MTWREKLSHNYTHFKDNTISYFWRRHYWHCCTTKETNRPTFLKLSLAVQLQQRDIIVQRLAVVVVMDVGGGHTQGLRARGAVLARQVVVTHAHVYRVARANDAGRKSNQISL